MLISLADMMAQVTSGRQERGTPILITTISWQILQSFLYLCNQPSVLVVQGERKRLQVAFDV